MEKTFLATEPGRYVQIERNVSVVPGDEHKINNTVTGYKMVIDLESGIYSSFIQEGDEPWLPHSANRRVSDMNAFRRDVGNGHLVEET